MGSLGRRAQRTPHQTDRRSKSGYELSEEIIQHRLILTFVGPSETINAASSFSALASLLLLSVTFPSRGPCSYGAVATFALLWAAQLESNRKRSIPCRLFSEA